MIEVFTGFFFRTCVGTNLGAELGWASATDHAGFRGVRRGSRSSRCVVNVTSQDRERILGPIVDGSVSQNTEELVEIFDVAVLSVTEDIVEVDGVFPS